MQLVCWLIFVCVLVCVVNIKWSDMYLVWLDLQSAELCPLDIDGSMRSISYFCWRI